MTWGDTQDDRISQLLALVTNNTNVLRLRKRVRPEGVTQLALRAATRSRARQPDKSLPTSRGTEHLSDAYIRKDAFDLIGAELVLILADRRRAFDVGVEKSEDRRDTCSAAFISVER